MNKAIFFDIDETLTTTISGATFKQSPTDIKVIEEAEAGLKYFKSRGYTLIGISNQGGVAAGHKSIETAIEEMQNILDLLPQLESIYICPDFEGNQAYKINPTHWLGFYRSQFPHPYMEGMLYESFRKPGTGMIFKALDDFNLFVHPDDDMNFMDSCWLVGDRNEDEQAAVKAGISFLYAETFHKRFGLGVFEFKNLTAKQIKFLEEIKI